MFLVLTILAITAFLLFVKYVYSYWNRHGFPNIEPSIPFGNLKSFIKRERSFGLAIFDLYNSSKEPFIGIYLFFRPAVLVRDANLAKRILTEDFSYFYDRGVHSNEKVNPISANLFNLRGKAWKDMRQKLSPSFTSGKLKQMFSTIEDVGNSMENYLKEIVPKEGKVIEMKDVTRRFAADILGSAFFGLEVNSFKDLDNDFFKLREKINPSSFLRSMASATLFLCPALYDALRLYKVNQQLTKEITEMVRQIIEHREKNNISRKDIMQLLIQLRNTGTIKEDGGFENITQSSSKTLTVEQIAAQVFIFYIAGLETTAATVSFCLWELSQNDEIKQKLLDDINTTLEKHNGVISYDSINDMKYLPLCLNETMRKYPGLPMLNRECTKRYRIPGSKYIIEEGTSVIISLLGLHMDPEYFTEPKKFIPERFTEEHPDYNSAAYLPFGDGPRICIGIRQGLLSTKVALVKILTNFHIEATSKKEMKFATNALALEPVDGIKLKLTKIVN